MTPEITELLEADIPPEGISKLLNHAVKLVNRARAHMSDNYAEWDKALDTYRCQRVADSEDKRAKQKREPSKMTVPMSKAQVDTLTTFLYLAFTQRDVIFDLESTGKEDFPIKDECQAVVDREVRNTTFHTKLIHALLDCCRFNLGVVKTSWKFESVIPPASDEPSFSAVFDEAGLMEEEAFEPEPEEIIVCEGNYVENISPYNFFFDTRLPQTKWKEGRFAADETTTNLLDLRALEKSGKYAGTKHVQTFDTKAWRIRRDGTRLDGIEPSLQRKDEADGDYMCCVTSMQIRLTPKDYDIPAEADDTESIWVVTYVNDNRIIGLEPLNAPHYEFQYDLFQLLPDQHSQLCDSLSALIDPLQEVITWLINARVASVRTNIEGKFVIDPQHVDTATLTSGNKYIQLKKNAPRLGVDKFIQQLKTVDPTTTHFDDAQKLMQVMQTVSGVNENAMGQYNGGRRSATEARTVSAAAASRMKLTASTIWFDGLASIGRKLLLNCRQDLSFETYEKIVGSERAAETYEAFHPANRYTLLGSEDFFVYDGTLSSEKGFIAQSLQELVIALISNPEMAMAMNLDIPMMIEEVQNLRGVKNLSKFRKPPQPNVSGTALPTLPTGIPPQLPNGAVGSSGIPTLPGAA